MAELLLHSLKGFDEVIFEMAGRMEPRGVLEIEGDYDYFTLSNELELVHAAWRARDYFKALELQHRLAEQTR